MTEVVLVLPGGRPQLTVKVTNWTSVVLQIEISYSLITKFCVQVRTKMKMKMKMKVKVKTEPLIKVELVVLPI
jgi:hypothetical protein